jgi:hypothetical protein
VYDAALRKIVEGDLSAACSLLGMRVETHPEVLTGALPTGTLAADLLLRVGAGRLVHVEYMRATASDLVPRMLIYRGLIMRAYPGESLSQHVIVLGDGRLRGYEEVAVHGFALDLRVLYLREVEPATVLAHRGLAPLAVLARGDASARSAAFAAALRIIAEDGGTRAPELLEFATRLATIRLDRPTIKQIVQEATVTVESLADLFRDTPLGREIRAEGRAALLLSLLEAKFGQDGRLPAIANRLSELTDGETARAVTDAASIDDLTHS